MTWVLTVTGHKADPKEEAEVLEVARRALAELRQVDQDLIQATFSGTYGFHDLLGEVKREAQD